MVKKSTRFPALRSFLMKSMAKGNGFPCIYPGYSYALFPDGTAEITRFDDIANPHQANEYVLNIPAVLDGHPVSSIGEAAFRGCNFLTEAIIPKGVTDIGGYAFQNCRGLQRVELPESFSSIGEYAFHFCTGLREIAIPDGVGCISSGTFSQCFMLESVAIPESVTVICDGAFFACGPQLTLTASPGSDAELYARRNRMNFKYPDDESQIFIKRIIGVQPSRSKTIARLPIVIIGSIQMTIPSLRRGPLPRMP